MENHMKRFIRTMKALSDPNRVKMLKLLQEKNLCVCELTHVLGLAQSTVSKHLKILEEAGLVRFEKEGAWVNYQLAAVDEDAPYAAAMLDQLRGWLEAEPQVKELRRKIKTVDRVRICAA